MQIEVKFNESEQNFDAEFNSVETAGGYILTEEDKTEIAAEAAAMVSGISMYICSADEVDENGQPIIAEPDPTTFYLVSSGEESPNLFIEWAYIGGAWERLGSATVDLSNYVQTADRDAFVKGGVTANTLPLTPDEQAAAQGWLGGQMLKTVEPDGDGIRTIIFSDAPSGIYFLDAGDKFAPRARDDLKTLAGAMALIVVQRGSYTQAFAYGNDFGWNVIKVYYVTDALSTNNPLNFGDVLIANGIQNIGGDKTFVTVPKMAATLAADDDSTNMPTTAWVNAAIKAAINNVTRASRTP